MRAIIYAYSYRDEYTLLEQLKGFENFEISSGGQTKSVKKTIQLIGKIIGIASGTGVSMSWISAMWAPTPALPLSGFSFGVALLMTLLAIIAVIASMRGHGITLIVLFFASFFPIGSFMLGITGWLWIIGILNVGYLIAGVIAWRIPEVMNKSAPQDIK